jgi:RNA polymerase sigma-70 factor (ECF subfamily)
MAPERDDDAIIHLIGSCQQRLFVYLRGLLGSRELAEEALQEANIVIWKKRSDYRSGTNFVAWACQIAFFEACKARQQRRRSVPVFSDVFIRGAAPELLAVAQASDSLETAVQDCVSKLGEPDRELIKQRYGDGVSIQDLADRVGCSTHSVYRSLRRIHRSLFDCINVKLREDDRA